VLKDIMASETEEEAANVGSGGRGRRKKREVRGDEEDENERALRERISAVRRLARERVGFEIVPGRGHRNLQEEWENEEQGMEAGEQQSRVRRSHAEEHEAEVADTREMEEIEKVGRWMGEVLRQ